MTRLAALRSRLAALRTARSVVRWGCALSVVVLGVLGYWAVAFLVDWSSSLSMASRLVMLVAFFVTLGWLIRRQVWPVAMVRESLEELALVVERAHQIDSDLVAALQFETSASATWGSPRLSAAVVDYVAEFSSGLDVFAGFHWRPLPQLAAAAIAAAVVSFGLAVAVPGHAAAFWNRFWLGTQHYPTRTVLAELTVNGQSIPVFHSQALVIRVPQGDPLRIRVQCQGELPREGTVHVRGLESGSRTTWPLIAGMGESISQFTAPAAPVIEHARLWITAGDAMSDPLEVTILPLPIIDLRWKVTAPAYAVGSRSEPIPAGARQFSVLPGARVHLDCECLNKSLEKIELNLEGRRVPLVTQTLRPDDRTVWSLPPGTPLDAVRDAVTFELTAVDADGLSPSPPLHGQIRLSSDRAPRVVAAAVTSKVLPTAKPRVTFGAADDFGLKQVRLSLTMQRKNADPETVDQVIWTRTENAPVATLKSELMIELTKYQLAKGDEVRIVVLAEDDRGDDPSQIGRSEPIVLEVTDRNGILAGLLETDQQSAKQLDAIIERELGIGGTRR